MAHLVANRMVWTAALVGACGVMPACSDSKPSSASTQASHSETTMPAKGADPSVLTYTMTRLDGTPESLSDFKGKVVLVVNTASKCGLTPQYEGLEKLYERKKDEGFVILGFPANDFMEQEPGTNAEIATFCSANYGVTFPMFEKIVVTGDGAHPLYRQLTIESEAPSWNFTKYLLDREGRLVKRYDPRTLPNDPGLTAEIDRLLSAG